MKRTLVRHLAALGAIFALGLAAPFPCAADDPPAATDSPATAESVPDDDADVDADAGEAPSVPLPAQELSEEILYHVLLGEIAGARRQLDLSARTYIDLARRTRDPRLARRATEIAFAARDLELAQTAARIWSETDPQSKDASRLLASVLRGDFVPLDDVEAEIARMLAQYPGNLAANLLGLNHAFARIENKSAAQGAIFRLTEPYLAHPEAYVARAQAAAIARHPMEALGAIDAALMLRPDWEPALLLKAQVLIASGAAAEGSKLVGVVLARHPDNRELRLTYGRSLAAARRYEDSLAVFRALLDETPADGEALYAAALLSLELDDQAAAETLLIRALEIHHPMADAIRLQLGQITEARGEHVAARKWFDAVGPGQFAIEARIRSARSLAREGRLDEARALLRRQADGGEDRQRLLTTEAYLLAEAGKAREAYALVDAALAKDPDNVDLLYETAMLAERGGMFEIMEGRLRKLIALHPEHAHAYNALGYSFADRGIRLEEAETLISRALELAPRDAFILDSKGWVRFKRGDLDGARAALEDAYSIRTDAEIAAHLGEVLWLLERTDDARQIFDKALSAHPDNTLLQETIRRLYLP
jgi:tetratricopeptide (TPR) repeat protein